MFESNAILVFTPFLIVIVQSISHFDLGDVCGVLGFKQSLYFNKKPIIFSFKSREKLNCHLELHLKNTQMGFYIFIERLQIQTTKECSTDFLQFGRDNFVFTSFVSEKYCETIEYPAEVSEDKKLIRYDFKNTSLEKREYIEDVDDEMDVWLDIRPARGKNRNEVVLLIVPFEKYCNIDDDFYRSCPSNSINCFETELFCENVLKCDIMDEEEQSYCSRNYNSRNILPIPLIIIIVTLSTIMAIFIACCIITMWLRFVKHQQNVHIDEEGLAEEVTRREQHETFDNNPSNDPWLQFEALASAPQMNPDISVTYSNPPTYEEVMATIGKDTPPPNYSQIG